MTSGRKTKPPKPDKTPAAVNDWGIPDWRDPTAYGDVKRWTYARWRWEFLRRRDNVRRFFDEALVELLEYDEHRKSKFDVSVFPGGYNLKPHEPGFRIKLSKRDQEYSGFYSLLNPRISEQPEDVLQNSFWAYDSTLSDFHGPDVSQIKLRVWLEICNILSDEVEMKMSESLLDSMPLTDLAEDDVVVVFSLNRPLKAQLRTAETALKDAYALKNKPTQNRRHPAKWLGYLRTLDAKESGASWREIAAIHPHTAGTEQAARDVWQAAEALRSNF